MDGFTDEQVAKFDNLQIEQAAKGCCSGTLAEWPCLKAALKRLGHDLPDSATGMELIRLCIKIQEGRGFSGYYKRAEISKAEAGPEPTVADA